MQGGWVGGLVLATCATGLAFIVLCGSSASAVSHPHGSRKSSVYCFKTPTDLNVYAGKIQPNGDLKFGLSLWEGSQNISLYGVAHRHGKCWEYRDKMDAAKSTDRCRLDITMDAHGAPRLSADPKASCQGDRGGYGTKIGTVQFPQSAYEGPVTSELDDSDEFQDAGKC